MSGIYIHIPFCKKACNYCDFHFSTNHNYINRMVNCICREIELKKNYLPYNTIINTIYFGGGTPSLLNSINLKKIIDEIKNNFEIATDVEITLEANPDDLNTQILEDFKRIGINRLSIGVQSFDNEVLQWMNRNHNAQQSINCVHLAQQLGFNNISIDLIYGLPIKDLPYWIDTINVALQLNVVHISAYCLTIENKTTFHHYLKTGKIKPINDELASEQFILLHNKLNSAGYIHYEISNFGKENYFSKHNTAYWNNTPYLGIGPSAHSYNKHNRSFNISNNQIYMKSVENNKNFTETEILNDKIKYNDYVLTRIRTIWGIDKKYIEQHFGHDKLLRIENIIKKQYKEYFNEHNDKFILTLQGMLFADKIAMELML